eukprot:Plantae.Rhodophyta-Hildenbrandia_rubra.ctg1374.p1 GENE.Plantae.Rhodophyta-Hildenbrandia_rubra.ctg1374~~Plantae.Rhodophyta-Hildenbrandia_rubra.ctg1374.p1  ORF type:complete len:454 (-),score=69.23 Plantae.Rhodophyta-Hildenbrandia_rubra.ctg1374:77-1438(-)
MKIQNWKGDIKYHASKVEVVRTPEEISKVVLDTSNYPSPVRVKGSHHSTTKCIVAEGGTVIDITEMNNILKIDQEAKTISMQAGVLHIDAVRELEKYGLQFYVNAEIGNMTMGSGTTCATKDSSFVSAGEVEYGQVSSYCIGMKYIGHDGEIVEISEEKDEKMMELLRGSYGMFGVVYEVTLRVKDLKPMAVKHVSFSLDEFTEQLDNLLDGGRSMALYLFPYRNKIVVEYRYDGDPSVKVTSWQWRLRNWVWKAGSPAFGKIVTALVSLDRLRSKTLDAYDKLSQILMTKLLHGKNTKASDQVIRFSETAGLASFTFSIWSFPRELYASTVRDYFHFCQDYFKKNGYRCDVVNVGYSVRQDRKSIFSYTREGPALTIDPVSSGSKGWEGFLGAYNEFCIQHDGKPLLNQTGGLAPLQAKAAFKKEIAEFQTVRHMHDPLDRFYAPFFRNLFE